MEVAATERTLLTTPCGSAKETFTARGNLTDEATVEIASALTPQQKNKRTWKIQHLLHVVYFMIIIVEFYTFQHMRSPLLVKLYYGSFELREFSTSVSMDALKFPKVELMNKCTRTQLTA